MAQIKIAEYTFDNSVGDVTLALTPNTITMTKEDSVSGTTTRRIVYIDNATMPTQIGFSVREPLLTVDYLNIDSNITSMYRLFHNAKNLTYINVDNWNTSNVTDFYQCFAWAGLTQNIDFTKMNLSKVTRWHMAFAYSSFPRIDLSNSSPTISDISKELFAYCKAEYINISGWTFTRAMNRLFNDAEQLKTVVLNNVTTTGVTDMKEMFRNCYNLKTIDVSSFDTSSVTDTSYMFNNCGKVTEIKGIENFNVSSNQWFNSMFYKCSSLTKLDLRNWVTSNAVDMSSMFNGCSSLTHADLSGFTAENCTSCANMFLNCKNLKTVDLSSFKPLASKKVNSEGMFASCSSLEKIDLSNFDTESMSKFNNLLNLGSRNITLGLLYASASTINDVISTCGSVENGIVYYYDADPSQLTPVEGVTFKKYVKSTTIQLPPHIQLHSLPDGTRDEVDIKTGTLIRRTQKIDNEIVALESPTTEQLILNYNNSCDYGRILPTGMCDKYNVVNSMYTQTMTSILLDGANTWDAMKEMTNVIKFTATGTAVGVEELNMLGAGGLYCDNDLFPNINDDSDVEHCRVDEAGNKFYIYISKDRLMSPDLIGWQIWLQANPFNMIYELAEHITYSKPYGELDPTQARWEGMDCMRDGAIKYHANNSDNITMYPTLEYVAPSINNFEVTMLEPNTDYTIYAEGINTNDTINLGGTDINFKNGTVYTSGDNQFLRIDNNDSFYNMVITKGDTTGEVVPYFEGMTSVENPVIDMAKEIPTIHITEIDDYVTTKNYRKDNKDVIIKTRLSSLTDCTIMQTKNEWAFKITYNATDKTIRVYNFNSDNGEVSKLINNVDLTNERYMNIYLRQQYVTIFIDGVNVFNNINMNKETTFFPSDYIYYYNSIKELMIFENVEGINMELNIGGSTVSYTDLKLRSLPNGVKDTINVVTGEYVQRVGEREYQDGDLTNENVLTDGINTMYELENYIITKLDTQTLLAYEDGTINLSSDTGLLPTTHYTVPSTNTFHLSSMKTGTRYTLKYPSASGSIAIGDITYKISSGSMLFTTPLKINGDTSAITFSDANPENVVLLEGTYNKREVPFFTGVKSVKNPNITIIDQQSTESTTYNCETEIELRGLPNGVADKLDIIKGKLTTNVGIRPYQEGDENLPNIWTDGYETVYALSSPVVTNVTIDHPTVTTNSLIELSSDYLIPQLNYRAPSSNNFPLDLLQPNQTYTLYADTLVSGSYTLGGTKTGVYSQPHTITLGDMTDNLLTFNGDLGLSNVMLVKGNSLKTTLPPYFLGIRSVTDGHLLVEGMAGEMNEITFDEGIVLRDCNGVKDTVDLITCTLTKRTGEVTLTGAEGWSILPNATINDDLQIFALTLPGINSSINNGLVCDKFIHRHMSEKLQDTEAIYSTNNQLILVVKKSRIGGDTVNALKSWLNQNPTTIVYPLITQLEIPLENVWTTTPLTSYDNQTEISSTVSSTSLKPMISVTIATTTLEEIVSNLEAQNEKLENENVATMLALTNIYETFATPIAVNETSTIDLSDGKDGNKVNGMSISPMGMVYVNLIKKGLKTIEQTPANLQAEVKYALKGLE